MDILVINFLGGISYGMVLFLIAAGLSLTLGIMGIFNLSHGVVFIAGGFVGLTVAEETGSFPLAILAGGAASGALGLFIERGFLRLFYKQALEQILITFGFIYIIANAILWIWGPLPKLAFVPSYFAGSVSIMGFNFPIYRFGIIGIGALICLGLWWLQEKTKIGAIVRAGMDDAETISGLGTNLVPINIGVFLLGSLLAGVACIIGVQLLSSITFNDGLDILLVAVSVCIIGGIGSIQGALVGALLIGIIDSLGRVYFPIMAPWTMYLLMILILMFRPSGLLGRKL